MKLIKTIDQKGFITTTNHRVFIFTDYEIMRGRSQGYREYKMISYSYSIHYPPISDEKLIQRVTDALKELINKEKQHVDNESK